MTISVCIGSYGDKRWQQLAATRARPSADRQGCEVVAVHLNDGNLRKARHACAKAATGDWLCFLDADDELHPGFIEAMERALPPAGAEALLTPAVQYVRWQKRQRPRIWPRVDLRDGNYLVIGTLIRREFFWEIGGFKDWPMYEDWDAWQRAAKAGATVIEVPDAIYIAHATPHSRNRAPSLRQKLAAHEAIRRANHPELYA